MSGVVAVYNFERERPVDPERVTMQTDVLAARGRAGGGVWVEQGAGLGHRRARVSETPAPLLDDGRRYVISFDGKLGERAALRDELAQAGYSTSSDASAELTLLAFVAWGEACAQHLSGPFAFVIYDSMEHELFAARDRLGERPLCFYHDRARVLVASTIDALVADPMVPRVIDATAVASYMALGYVPAPKSIYRDIAKLPPGHALRCRSGSLQSFQYWDVDLRAPDETTSLESHAEALRTLLTAAVGRSCAGSTTIGVLSDGGLASSLLAAVAAPSGKVETIELSRVFMGDADEALVLELASFYDEPRADLAAAKQLIAQRKWESHPALVVSAAGGAELFSSSSLPSAAVPPLRQRVASAARATAARSLGSLLERTPLRTLVTGLPTTTDDRAAYARRPGEPLRYAELLARDVLRTLGDHDPYETVAHLYARAGTDDAHARETYAAIKGLADDTLTSLDRVAAASDLELSCPLLEHRVVEYAARIPSAYKVAGPSGVLARAAAPLVMAPPAHVAPAPASWLRGSLAAAVQASLLGPNLSRILEKAEIERRLREHREGRRDHGAQLWRAFMFERWYEQANDAARGLRRPPAAPSRRVSERAREAAPPGA